MGRLTRRQALRATAAAAGILPLTAEVATGRRPPMRSGRLKQSVSRWPYKDMPLRDFARACADMGLTAIDLLDEPDWNVVREFGLVCSMGYAGGGTIADGLNNPANHDAIVRNFERTIPRAAAAKVPNVITFFGNRRGMSDRDAIAHTVDGLHRIKKVAEDHGVTVCVELLNSKIDHADYQGDHTSYGVEVITRVDSPRVKLLYDIYHMQIMEGDVIRTIRANGPHIAHFHTGGVPGRHELDDTQELNWKGVCRAIVETGFAGFVAHEFVPIGDPLAALRAAVSLCDV